MLFDSTLIRLHCLLINYQIALRAREKNQMCNCPFISRKKRLERKILASFFVYYGLFYCQGGHILRILQVLRIFAQEKGFFRAIFALFRAFFVPFSSVFPSFYLLFAFCPFWYAVLWQRMHCYNNIIMFICI